MKSTLKSIVINDFLFSKTKYISKEIQSPSIRDDDKDGEVDWIKMRSRTEGDLLDV